MKALIERASDRLVGMVVPKATAKADLCSCSVVGQEWWGAYCFCYQLTYQFYKRAVCNGCHYGAATCANRWWRC